MTEQIAEFTTFLLCDNPLLRAGLESILSKSPFALTRTAPAASLKTEDRATVQPALIIIATDHFSGRIVEVVREAKEKSPRTRIVVLVDQFDSDSVRAVFEAGADGFNLTIMNSAALITYLELVMLGETMVPVALVGALLSEEHSNLVPAEQKFGADALHSSNIRGHSLSHREAEILRCLTQGDANKVIARKLDISEATIKVHVKAILRKIGAANRTQAAMWATAHFPASVNGLWRA